MTSKTNFINYFLLAFTLAFISSGLSAGTLDFKDKKKDKEKKEQKSDCKKIEKIPYLKSANIKTVLYRSINQILKEQASPEKRTVLLLITDGEDDSQGKDINNVSTAKTVKEASIPVYGIMLNRKPP